MEKFEVCRNDQSFSRNNNWIMKFNTLSLSSAEAALAELENIKIAKNTCLLCSLMKMLCGGE